MTVHLSDDELILHDFHETDPDVLAFVREAEDADAAVHRCLAMGARALRLAGATLDGALVEHKFEEMTTGLDRSVEDFARRVDESAERLLDEETGELSKALHVWLDEVTTILGDTFDENSKRSAIAKLENVLEKARKEQVSSVRQLLDPDNDESPLSRWRREIIETVKEQGKTIEDHFAQLKTTLAVDDARAKERELGTRKGSDFQDMVLDEVTCIVKHLEDVPEGVFDVIGSAGAKVGDIVVTVNPAHTPGRTARYVLEAKDKKASLKNALAELDAALANRDAAAAIMVFADTTLCPVDEPFQWFDRKALVVLDKDDLDPHALRLACLWARWIACREEAEEIDAVDRARVQALIDDARRSLKSASAIRGSHTKAKTAIDQASRQLEGLLTECAEALDELGRAILEPAG